ncbi:TetR family transcriptional regulator-like protein [Paraburkholderia piptadeniae]|uniref:TetR family transcriptional regulator-like protein n=1 Tax=Paraburkholderia piptadeniae TaxID=1701573 RepID=A0A1N7SSG8_9BURK|nr:TetR family transcriptional regulator [Paraburkholderia piptadeniae]SIT50333.1 TetR family transcriptional regulator-like protein [Paraburkholderia piptadeniae]
MNRDTYTRRSRPRNRAATQQQLYLAISRVKQKGLGLSITAVAAEAGVSASLIHNTYPDIAEEIRARIGRAMREQRDAKAAELDKARADLRELRNQLRVAKDDLARLASVNETLSDEIACLRGQISGRVRVLPRRDNA